MELNRQKQVISVLIHCSHVLDADASELVGASRCEEVRGTESIMAFGPHASSKGKFTTCICMSETLMGALPKMSENLLGLRGDGRLEQHDELLLDCV